MIILRHDCLYFSWPITFTAVTVLLISVRAVKFDWSKKNNKHFMLSIGTLRWPKDYVVWGNATSRRVIAKCKQRSKCGALVRFQRGVYPIISATGWMSDMLRERWTSKVAAKLWGRANLDRQVMWPKRWTDLTTWLNRIWIWNDQTASSVWNS